MTTKADTSVKWFHSGMADAPVLRGEVGALIELLDACLINGFSTRSPDSVVVAGGVATVSIGAGNPYDKHAVVKISGASDPALNAEWKIDTSAASSFTFLCSGVADGTVTGATIQRAGAGWGKPFSGTNVAVYQSQDPASTQLFLRVNDADARYTRVRGYEQMTDANTGTGEFPTLTQRGETVFTWMKSTVASATARDWVVVADGAFFWFLPRGNPLQGGTLNLFGDFVSFVAGDKYNAVIAAHLAAAPASNATDHPTSQGYESSYPRYVARAASQSGGSAAVAVAVPSPNSSWNGYGLTVTPALGLFGAEMIGPPPLVRIGVYSSDDYRGLLPGARASFYPETLPPTKIIEVDGAILLKCASASARGVPGGTLGTAFFDIKGPWR